MKKNHTLHKTIWLLSFALLFAISFFLMKTINSELVQYLPIALSFPAGFFLAEKISKEDDQKIVSEDIGKSWETIRFNDNSVMRRFCMARNKVLGPYRIVPDDFDMSDCFSSPIIFVLCLCLVPIFYMEQSSISIENASDQETIKYVLMGLVQWLLMSMVFCNLMLIIKKTIGKHS